MLGGTFLRRAALFGWRDQEPGFDCASTVRMTLQSLAAQMDVPFQAGMGK
jgi:hypothetical protein